MKIRRTLFPIVTLSLLAAISLPAADSMTRYGPRSGSKMRLEGTSNVHDWRAEAPLILGFLEVGPGFPTEPGQAVTPGKIEARGQAVVITRSLISKKENGEHYENKMDDNMYKGLKADALAGSNIVFQVSELTLKEAPKSKDAPYLFESKGDLAIAGVTNRISMPITVILILDEKQKITKLKISGTTPVKMSDFQIKQEKFLAGLFTVGDEVKVKFDWMLAPQAKPASAANK